MLELQRAVDRILEISFTWIGHAGVLFGVLPGGGAAEMLAANYFRRLCHPGEAGSEPGVVTREVCNLLAHALEGQIETLSQNCGLSPPGILEECRSSSGVSLGVDVETQRLCNSSEEGLWDISPAKCLLWTHAIDTVCLLLNTDGLVMQPRLPFYVSTDPISSNQKKK